MAQPPSSESEALAKPSAVSLPSFPPHRRRLLKSDTLSTYLQLISHAYCPKPDAENNEVERTTEVRVDADNTIRTETEINEAQHVNEDRIQTNEVDLRSRINKEPVLKIGKGCNELGQTTVCGGGADATTNIESEMLSANGDDALCSKVINVSESIHGEMMETNEFDGGNRTNKEKETSFEIPNSLEKTSLGTSVEPSATIDELEQTTKAVGTNNTESETLPTNGDDTNSIAETEGFDSETITNVELGQETGLEIVGSLEETNPESDVTLFTPVDEPQNSLVRSLLEDSETMPQVDMDKEDSSCKLTEEFRLSLDIDETAKYPVIESSELNQGNLEDFEIEEGEVLGDLEIDDEMIDFIFEEPTSEPIVNKEHISDPNHEVKNKLDKDVEVVVEGVGKGTETNYRERNASESETVGKVPDWESVMKYQDELFADKDPPGGQKKRKRGPMTQEKRAKKKKKERIKRAEKNKQLGVKRLKIQPVVMKPKPVGLCRHYIKGRCQEGDKCKFSHDTTPETKSKPCGHFARNSCMKGDDCPYDHQLSKYPCNNFVTKGYCGRGTDCMFSHKVQRSEDSAKSVNASSSEAKDSSLSWVTNCNNKTSSQKPSTPKVDPKPSSVAKSSFVSAQQKIAEIKLRAAAASASATAEEPKGLSKLLFGKSSSGNEAKTSSRTDSNVKVVSPPVVNNTQNTGPNLNGASKVTAHIEPKGVNFLSFNKSPTEKADLVSNSSETPKRDPPMPPRGINFLSFGKPSSNMMVATPGASSSGHERDQSGKGTPSSALKALLSTGSSSAHKALQSTLAFASKFEPRIKTDHPVGSLNTSDNS